MTAIERLMGKPDRCRRFSEDVASHWYPSPTATTCFCGEIIRPAPVERNRA